jgi:ADP-ribosylglycohydrolase
VITVRDRLVGGLVGLLVGDALGVPVEFTGRQVRDSDPVTGMRGGGTWRQPAGTWSDDSSMALTNAEVLVEHGWDPGRTMDGYRAWLEQARWTARGAVFDVGSTTQNAIMYYRIHGDWRECGLDEAHNNGNGSLMRCLPMSCWLFGRAMEDQLRLAGEASALTHAHLRSRLCCAWHARWCDGLLSGRDVRDAARAASAHLRRHVPADEREPLGRLLEGTVLDLDRSQVAIPQERLDALARGGEVVALAERFADACIAQWERPAS